jgi:hypothetical protein
MNTITAIARIQQIIDGKDGSENFDEDGFRTLE